MTLEAIKTILTKVGREPAEAVDLVSRMEVEADSFSFEDFLKIMKNLEGRLIAVKEQEHQKALMDEEAVDFEPREGTLEDRNQYGPLLPRTGVHFLPDSKVVDFLK